MPDEVQRQDAEYALRVVERVCREAGPGVPCSPEERARAEILREEMARLLGEDEVAVEEFECAPTGFLGWFRHGVVLALLSLGCHTAAVHLGGAAAIACAAASAVLALLILVMAVSQFVLCKELFDRWLPKRQSLNVAGRIPARGSGPPRTILVFAGHHDSAHQFNWVHYLKHGYYLTVAVIFWAVVALAFRTGLYLAGLLADDRTLVELGEIGLRTLLLPLAPGLLFAFFFLGSGKHGGRVPGAADNLSGCALALAIGRILGRHPDLVPVDAEVRLVTFGAEEAGCRGSRRYVERHLEELCAARTKLFNIETVAHPVIGIMRSDCNGLQKSSPVVVEEMVRAARAADVPYRVRSFPFGSGGTDALAFTEAGLDAACVLPFEYPRQQIQFYHQATDEPSVLTLEPFENTLALAVEWIRLQAPEEPQASAADRP